jgi:hypothetical protein
MNPIELLRLLAQLKMGVTELRTRTENGRRQLAAQFPQAPSVHTALAASDTVFADVEAKLQARIDAVSVSNAERVAYASSHEQAARAGELK